MSKTKCKPLPQLSAVNIHNFWKHVDKRGPEECWPWTGRRVTFGQGHFNIGGIPRIASRIAYFLATGCDPYPLEIRHTCDNPPCCNSAHLLTGTHKQNMEDMARRGRAAAGDRSGPRLHPERMRRGEQVPQARLTDERVRMIRADYAARMGGYIILGRKYNVNPWTIRDVVKRRKWKHVD